MRICAQRSEAGVLLSRFMSAGRPPAVAPRAAARLGVWVPPGARRARRLRSPSAFEAAVAGRPTCVCERLSLWWTGGYVYWRLWRVIMRKPSAARSVSAGLLSLCVGTRHAPVAHMCTSGASSHARIVIAQRNTPPDGDEALRDLAQVDTSFATRVVSGASPEHTRVILSPVGSCDNEMDDVRKVGEAAASGAIAAFAMGAWTWGGWWISAIS